MATFRATFGKSHGEGVSAAYPPGLSVFELSSMDGLTELTTSGTAGNVQSGGSDFEAPYDGFVTMVCDGAVWVKVGTDPTAAVGSELYLKADERFEGAIKSGHKISVIDDS